MKNFIVFFILVIYLNLGAQPMKTAYINGVIFTCDENNSKAEAILVKENKIEFVGKNNEVL
ncbi:MAG: hypothetical protein N2043_04655, partial [Ignavibacterium sp.]|nr:hypothetical protein [Ignavibacterium sp.]